MEKDLGKMLDVDVLAPRFLLEVLELNAYTERKVKTVAATRQNMDDVIDLMADKPLLL